MKTYAKKYNRTDWENDGWNNRGNSTYRWNIVTDTGIVIDAPEQDIDRLADGEDIIVYVTSWYYQFGSPCTRYYLSTTKEKSLSTPYGDLRNHGAIKLVRNGMKLFARNVDCLI